MPFLDLPSAHFDAANVDASVSVGIAKLHGVTDKDVLSRAANHTLFTRDYLYTWSIMCDPDDKTAFGRLDAAMTASDLKSALRVARNREAKGMVSSEIALALADAEDWRALLDNMINQNAHAHVASGFILRWAISRWQRPETKMEASLSKAISVVEEWYSANRLSGGSRQNLKQHVWPKFRCVAHFWAAHLIMDDLRINIASADGFRRFLSTAQGLLERAAQIVPKGRRSGEGFLSLDESWSVPPSYTRRSKVDGQDTVDCDWIVDVDSHDIRKANQYKYWPHLVVPVQD